MSGNGILASSLYWHDGTVTSVQVDEVHQAIEWAVEVIDWESDQDEPLRGIVVFSSGKILLEQIYPAIENTIGKVNWDIDRAEFNSIHDVFHVRFAIRIDGYRRKPDGFGEIIIECADCMFYESPETPCES